MKLNNELYKWIGLISLKDSHNWFCELEVSLVSIFQIISILNGYENVSQVWCHQSFNVPIIAAFFQRIWYQILLAMLLDTQIIWQPQFQHFVYGQLYNHVSSSTKTFWYCKCASKLKVLDCKKHLKFILLINYFYIKLPLMWIDDMLKKKKEM